VKGLSSGSPFLCLSPLSVDQEQTLACLFFLKLFLLAILAAGVLEYLVRRPRRNMLACFFYLKLSLLALAAGVLASSAEDRQARTGQHG